MSEGKDKIKYIQTLPEPRIRKRDGAIQTHCISIGLTTEEALELSQIFQNPEKISISLVRAFLLAYAEGFVDMDLVQKQAVRITTKRELTKVLSEVDCNRALTWLDTQKKKEILVVTKKLEPIITKMKSISNNRRVFVPEPVKKKQ